MSENIEIENEQSDKDVEEEEEEEEKKEQLEDITPESVPETFYVSEPEQRTTDGHTGNNVVVRRFIIQVLSALYCLLLVSLGIVFPIALYLSGRSFRKHGLHFAIYRYYTLGVGIAVYVYMAIRIRLYKKTKETKIRESQDSEKKRKPRREVYVINDDVMATNVFDDTNENTAPVKKDEIPAIYETPEGVNFFLRLGLIVFGLGGMLIMGVRIVDFFEHEAIIDCYGPTYQVSSFLAFFFIIVQTAFLFKYHKTCVNVHKPILRFGILHNVATNLSLWASIIVLEAVEAYNHYVHNAHTDDSHNGGSHLSTSYTHSPDTTSSYQGTPPSHNSTDEDDFISSALCASFPNTLGSASSPFLFPFIIEYCLLSAAILYRMLDNIGAEMYYEGQRQHKLKRIDRDRFPDLYANQPPSSQCVKSNRGLFFGLLIFLVVAIGVCFFLFLTASGEEYRYTTGMIYVSSDLTVKILVILFIIPAFWQIKRLHFSIRKGNILDQQLLVFALFGTYLLDGFTVMAAFASVNSPHSLKKLGSQLIAATCIINFIQVTLLVAFIVDGLQRRSVTSRHVIKKPGRAFVTLLLILNLSLWIIISFEMKMVHRFTIFSSYYGQLGWTIILSVVGPVAIYFRFHCAVCLSDIWIHSYKKSPRDDPGEREIEKCGKIL